MAKRNDSTMVVLAEKTTTRSTLEQALAQNAQFYNRSTPVEMSSRYRITLNTSADGRVDISCELRSHLVRMSPSGKAQLYWQLVRRDTLFRTRRNILVIRSTTDRSTHTARLWGPDAIEVAVKAMQRSARLTRAHKDLLEQELLDRMGHPERLVERTPLLDPEHPDCIQRSHERSLLDMAASVIDPWIDAPDASVVAKRLFGTRNYRRPLAGLVCELGPEELSFFSAFRGLVPIEAIIDAMRRAARSEGPRADPYFTTRSRTARRALLRATPAPVLTRMLRAPVPELRQAVDHAANHVAGRGLHPAALTELIAARGQRNLRSPAEWEQIVRRIQDRPPLTTKQKRSIAASLSNQETRRMVEEMTGVNAMLVEQGRPAIEWAQWRSDEALRAEHLALVEELRIARMQEQQRLEALREEELRQERLRTEAQTTAWAQDLTDRLEGARIGGFVADVAASASQLSLWGTAMGNCIGQYSRELGLDVFVSLRPPEADEPATASVLQLQITRDEGILQILGKHNSPAIRAVGPEGLTAVLSDLAEFGALASEFTWGTTPEQLQAAYRR